MKFLGNCLFAIMLCSSALADYQNTSQDQLSNFKKAAMFTDPAGTEEFRTQDNMNYNILLKENLTVAQVQLCTKQICELSIIQGNGTCVALTFIGVVTANLTNYAAQRILKMACVATIELDGSVHANPSIGSHY